MQRDKAVNWLRDGVRDAPAITGLGKRNRTKQICEIKVA